MISLAKILQRLLITEITPGWIELWEEGDWAELSKGKRTPWKAGGNRRWEREFPEHSEWAESRCICVWDDSTLLGLHPFLHCFVQLLKAKVSSCFKRCSSSLTWHWGVRIVCERCSYTSFLIFPIRWEGSPEYYSMCWNDACIDMSEII